MPLQIHVPNDCAATLEMKAAFPTTEQTVSRSKPASAKFSIENLLNGRIAITPAELAALFGRHATWGYRQVYAGRVKVIRGAGRILIPLQEIERFASDTIVYGEADDSGAKPKNNHFD